MKGVDVTATGQGGPACGLYCSADSERQLALAADIAVGTTVDNQAKEVSVAADDGEAVVMTSDVGYMFWHPAEDALTGPIEKPGVVGGFEFEQCRAELEALRPIGPGAGCVSASHGENRRPFGGVPALGEISNLAGRQGKEPFQPRLQRAGSQGGVNVNQESLLVFRLGAVFGFGDAPDSIARLNFGGRFSIKARIPSKISGCRKRRPYSSVI